MSDIVTWGVLGYARIARQSVIPAIERAENARLLGLPPAILTDYPRISGREPMPVMPTCWQIAIFRRFISLT